jgi:hypothetical protein
MPRFCDCALCVASYLRGETCFPRFGVLPALRSFFASLSINVMTAPSILLSVVRYGRTRSEYSRPSLSVTLRSRARRLDHFAQNIFQIRDVNVGSELAQWPPDIGLQDVKGIARRRPRAQQGRFSSFMMFTYTVGSVDVTFPEFGSFDNVCAANERKRLKA